MIFRWKRKVRYYIQDGPTIEGVEAGRTRSDYIVWSPKIIGDGDSDAEVRVSGHVEIERSRVVWRQVVG